MEKNRQPYTKAPIEKGTKYTAQEHDNHLDLKIKLLFIIAIFLALVICAIFTYVIVCLS